MNFKNGSFFIISIALLCVHGMVHGAAEKADEVKALIPANIAKQYFTAIEVENRKGGVSEIERLIKEGLLDPNGYLEDRDGDKVTPLLVAAREDRTGRVVASLLKLKADVNREVTMWIDINKFGTWSPITAALCHSNGEAFAHLLRAGGRMPSEVLLNERAIELERRYPEVKAALAERDLISLEDRKKVNAFFDFKKANPVAGIPYV